MVDYEASMRWVLAPSGLPSEDFYLRSRFEPAIVRGTGLDLLLPVLGALVAVIAMAAVLWYRKRKIEHAHASLERAAEDLGHIETTLDPFLRTGDYIPERVRRPLDAKAAQVAEEVLPPITKIAQRTRNISMRDLLGRTNRKANELSKPLSEHNDGYLQRRIAEHSTLLGEGGIHRVVQPFDPVSSSGRPNRREGTSPDARSGQSLLERNSYLDLV
jgi:hypothetical protein